MSAPVVLIVDDDPAIRESLSTELEAAGFGVATASDGREAEEVLAKRKPDLVLTDLAMPRMDGFALIAGIRSRAGTPIIVVSVRGRDQDKVRALDLGADDYVTKPFSMPELLARVRAQLRRSGGGAAEEVLRFPDLTIDLVRRKVVRSGREIRLTPTEFELLALFARNAGRPVTLRQIASRVWEGAPATTNDTIRVHVGSLRRKIEPDPSNPRYLVTEPWVGYRFIAEPLRSSELL